MDIAIVGLGVIGGSFAKAIKDILPPTDSVYGIDIDQTTLDFAREGGYIVYGERVNESILQIADLVILGLYPDSMKDFLIQHQAEFKEGAIILDTSGVKQILMEDIEAYFPPQADLILGHPMAGREKKGFAFADSQVYQDANFLLTPVAQNKQENIEFVTDLLYKLGFGRVTLTTPAVHDEMIAYTSQLAHVLAVALINADRYDNETIRFVGDSFRDFTRIANINADLWAELFLENRSSLLRVMEEFKLEFDKVHQAIQDGDQASLVDLFEESSYRRQKLEQSDYKLSKHQGQLGTEKDLGD